MRIMRIKYNIIGITVSRAFRVPSVINQPTCESFSSMKSLTSHETGVKKNFFPENMWSISFVNVNILFVFSDRLIFPE